jgi:hypothetical protein
MTAEIYIYCFYFILICHKDSILLKKKFKLWEITTSLVGSIFLNGVFAIHYFLHKFEKTTDFYRKKALAVLQIFLLWKVQKMWETAQSLTEKKP